MKLLLYCTKAKPYLYDHLGIRRSWDKRFNIQKVKQSGLDDLLLNGKIVAECDFEVEEITIGRSYGFRPNMCIISTKNLQPIELLSKSCYESYDDLFKYLKYDFDNDYGTHKGPYGYAIHIRNLHIFGEPKELSDYKIIRNNGYSRLTLTKAPQNMMKVKEFKNGIVADYVLISIHPEELCKILNGEKTIEVRKKVLKEVLSDESKFNCRRFY